jgi:hypothetical protein
MRANAWFGVSNSCLQKLQLIRNGCLRDNDSTSSLRDSEILFVGFIVSVRIRIDPAANVVLDGNSLKFSGTLIVMVTSDVVAASILETLMYSGMTSIFVLKFAVHDSKHAPILGRNSTKTSMAESPAIGNFISLAFNFFESSPWLTLGSHVRCVQTTWEPSLLKT